MSNKSIMMVLFLFKLVAITGLSMVIGKYTCPEVGLAIFMLVMIATFSVKLKEERTK